MAWGTEEGEGRDINEKGWRHTDNYLSVDSYLEFYIFLCISTYAEIFHNKILLNHPAIPSEKASFQP